jgi:hypothetical protein
MSSTKFDTGRFNLKRPNELDITGWYEVKISARLFSFGKLG